MRPDRSVSRRFLKVQPSLQVWRRINMLRFFTQLLIAIEHSLSKFIEFGLDEFPGSRDVQIEVALELHL